LTKVELAKTLLDRAARYSARIALPEATDARTLRAARLAQKQSVFVPVLVGKQEAIEAAAAEEGIDLDGIEQVDPLIDGARDAHAAAYATRREVSQGLAARLLRKPLAYAAAMTAAGNTDGVVAGATCATAQVISTTQLVIGLADGVAAPSSFFLMDIPSHEGGPHRTLAYADAALQIQPDAAALATIAVSTAASFQTLIGEVPRVAMLSFSSHGSAHHPDVDKVIEATARAKVLAPELALDGELQGDVALSSAVAETKGVGGQVAGQANVLVFPDLDAANIAYKLTQYLAAAIALGPITQGFRCPVNDLSRGATDTDIVTVGAITAIQASS
jgi:phosphate acetyltransferase